MTQADSLPDLLFTPASKPGALMLFAHGAGAPMDSDFMTTMAQAVADQGISVARFEFPYMQRRRQEQRKFPPDRAPALLAHFQRVLAQAAEHGLPIWIAGKSMGGRMASMLAAERSSGVENVQGVIALGYPFHPPGKPEKTRTEHLYDLTMPMLICQGTRDPFGKPVEVSGYDLPVGIQVHWLEGGDHDFKPLKRSGFTQTHLIAEAAEQVSQFILS